MLQVEPTSKSGKQRKKSKPVKCPKCGSEESFRAKREGIVDKSLSLVGLFPYYCGHHSCRQRFFYSQR